jgi:hypothetical protein
MSYEKAPILSTLSKVHNNELVLPAIQRDFVWHTERMVKLLDSIFRGYPFSTLLFWNTKQRIQYREFTKDWRSGQRYTFQIKPEGEKGTMVLDGQQRLQTLYLAIYGSYEQKILYFDILSGLEPDDLSQARYHFEFMSAGEAEPLNHNNEVQQYWIPLRDLADVDTRDKLVVADDYIKEAGVAKESESGRRLVANIDLAITALQAEESLNYFTIDKNYGERGRTTGLDEILEIFVRVNSGGEVLSKSDLMFSLMQMLWEGAADAIAELTDRLNAKERYDFDKDFILKTALVCTNRGARYQVDKLRNETYVKEIEQSFPRIAEALVNCKDFIVSKARFLDDRILRSYNTLIPFVYFFYLQPNQQVKSEETLLRMNHALYLSLMTNLYSRFADNYIDQVVNNIILPYHVNNPGQFPLDEYLVFLHSKQGRSQLDDWLLQNNISYLMNILEGGTRLPEGRRSRRPEVDHIFPNSKLQALGVPDDRINHFANFRLISQPENNWKRAQDPQPYFKANPKAAERYYIPTNLLAYEQYEQFLEKRRELIWGHLKRFFGQDGSPNGGISSNHPVDKNASSTDDPALLTKDKVEAAQPTAMRQAFNEILNEEQKALPILQDTTQWIEIFRAVPFSPQWCRRYERALLNSGIRNVGDFAAAVMALKLKITNYSYQLPFYTFVSPLPDGKELRIHTREFGGYAWKWALATLERRGFDWTQYTLK